MNRIEIVGAAGAGKSTLYNALVKKRNSTQHWLTPTEARIEIAKSIMKDDTRYRKYLLFPGLKIPSLATSIVNRVLKNEYKKSIWDYNNEWQHLIHSLLMNITFPSNESLRILYRYSWLLARMEEAALYEKYLPDRCILLEEPIFHKLTNIIILFNKDQTEKIANSLFSKTPLPYGIIHVSADPELIYNRLSLREKNAHDWMLGFRDYDTDTLFDMVVNSIKVIDIGVQVMKERGVEVLDLQASEEVDIKVDKVNRFMHGISQHRMSK